MQPVSMLMSNLNVEANTHHAPNALAAAQDTGQSQEIVREGIRVVQTVQASESAKEAQRVHRKNENDERDERDGSRKKRDTFELTEHPKENPNDSAPLLRENVKSKKSFSFYA
ncbi:MAG: hypothetical protein IJU31_03655 [Synergistaceae bacterium]|nr:hypothetical protein [Synergistaceae bacterium]